MQTYTWIYDNFISITLQGLTGMVYRHISWAIQWNQINYIIKITVLRNSVMKLFVSDFRGFLFISECLWGYIWGYITTCTSVFEWVCWLLHVAWRVVVTQMSAIRSSKWYADIFLGLTVQWTKEFGKFEPCYCHTMSLVSWRGASLIVRASRVFWSVGSH